MRGLANTHATKTGRKLDGDGLLDAQRPRAEPVGVAEEEHALHLPGDALARLDPHAPLGRDPQRAQEAERAAARVGAVVAAHDGPDGLGSLVGVVEGDGGDVVVQDVGLDDAVEELPADEAELAVDGGGRAARVRPGVRLVVRQGRVRVLQERDADWAVSARFAEEDGRAYRASGSPRWCGMEVPHEHVGQAELLDGKVQRGAHQTEADVAQDDQVLVLALEERARAG